MSGTVARRNGELGYWHQADGGIPALRDPLPGSQEADVAIVGAGFTGLWTAYYLKKTDPGLRVMVLEAKFAGFGASGRNGGWLMGICEGRLDRYARRGGVEAVIRLQRELRLTLPEIERVMAAEGIEAELVRSGALHVAIGPAQDRRLRRQFAELRGDPLVDRPDDVLLERDSLAQRLRIADARSAILSPHTARVHPVRLLRGLAAAVEALGVPIHESTPVGEIRPGEAVTERGTVKARWVVRATEGYTPSLPGSRRLLAPVNSSIIITDPLPDPVLSEIGWEGAELVGDSASRFIYMQRTADGRIAIGGRGIPYRFGSATDFGAGIAPATVRELHRKLLAMFPVLAGCGIAHGWSGVIGVPRDWCVSVNADRGSGLAWAGGYSGEGVAATNLAGRVLTDLLLDRDTELTRLPWVGRRPPLWEPEPLRYLGIRSMYSGYAVTDRIERLTGRPSQAARLLDRLTGR